MFQWSGCHGNGSTQILVIRTLAATELICGQRTRVHVLRAFPLPINLVVIVYY